MSIQKHNGGPCPVEPEALVVTKLRGGWVRKAHLASKCRWEIGDKPSPGDVTHWRLATGTDLKE